MTGSVATRGGPGAKAWLLWGAFGLLATLLAALWLAGPLPAGEAAVCLLRREFAIACPTCGLTRALRLLLHGDWGASLAVHPLAAPLLLQAVGGWIAWATWLARGATRPDRWIPLVAALDGAVFAAVWGARALTGALPT